MPIDPIRILKRFNMNDIVKEKRGAFEIIKYLAAF